MMGVAITTSEVTIVSETRNRSSTVVFSMVANFKAISTEGIEVDFSMDESALRLMPALLDSSV